MSTSRRPVAKNRPRLYPPRDKVPKPAQGFEFERLLYGQYSDAMSLEEFVELTNPTCPDNAVQAQVTTQIELDNLASDPKKRSSCCAT